MIDNAKISGIMPAAFTFSGMCVLWPPYIRLPRMRLAYCTGMRRSPIWMITMAATVNSSMTRKAA